MSRVHAGRSAALCEPALQSAGAGALHCGVRRTGSSPGTWQRPMWRRTRETAAWGRECSPRRGGGAAAGPPGPRRLRAWRLPVWSPPPPRTGRRVGQGRQSNLPGSGVRSRSARAPLVRVGGEAPRSGLLLEAGGPAAGEAPVEAPAGAGVRGRGRPANAASSTRALAGGQSGPPRGNPRSSGTRGTQGRDPRFIISDTEGLRYQRLRAKRRPGCF